MRHGIYTESLLVFLPRALQSGIWAPATGNKPCHYVTREDCARADAAALASVDTEKRIYEVTGPTAPTAKEVAAIVSEVTGKPLGHMDITINAFRNGLEGAGFPPTLVGAMSGFALATAWGFYGTVTPIGEEMTGHKPASVRDFVIANKAAFVNAS